MAGFSQFSRTVDSALLGALRQHPLFTENLLPAIHASDWKDRVFPAVRGGRIDFYYGGGKLFTFDGRRFLTHLKYASVAEADVEYVSEADLAGGGVKLLSDFLEGYDRIRENCARYAGVEAQGVANVYARSGFACCPDDVVVLDIEVSLGGSETANEGRGGKQSRIDVLLFNKATKTLRFYEAKHYSNPELWAAPGRPPAVVRQLNRYNRIVGSAARRRELLNAYSAYVDVANDVFVQNRDCRLPHPEEVEQNVVLFVFGYDRGQVARMKNLLIDDGSLKGHRLRTRGATGDLTAAALWRRVRSCES